MGSTRCSFRSLPSSRRRSRRGGRRRVPSCARRRHPVGPHDLRIVRLARTGADDARDSGLEGRKSFSFVYLSWSCNRATCCNISGASSRAATKWRRGFPVQDGRGDGRRHAQRDCAGRRTGGITPFVATPRPNISLAINLFGFVGGLVMSAFKRRRGIKDWGTMIQGHGGMFDRLDSWPLGAGLFPRHALLVGGVASSEWANRACCATARAGTAHSRFCGP